MMNIAIVLGRGACGQQALVLIRPLHLSSDLYRRHAYEFDVSNGGCTLSFNERNYGERSVRYFWRLHEQGVRMALLYLIYLRFVLILETHHSTFHLVPKMYYYYNKHAHM